MVFSSAIFLFVFLPLSLAGYYLIDRRFKNIFLLIASLLFYAWGEPKFVFVMMFSILVNHVFALLIDRNLTRAEQLAQHSTAGPYRTRAKSWLCLMVVFNLSLFFVYKYLNFTIANVNRMIGLFGAGPFAQTDIALPIGISFFTFQAMSYVFDVYRRKGQVQKNPLNTMLYVAMFPQLIAGPIVRYETVADEIRNRRETLDDFTKGIKRFIIGLSKKAILANSVAIIADKAFSYTDFSQLTVLMAWLGAVAYALQIYFDFGGYSDMAIGLGLMFGFHFDENFDYPYISRTIAEFWRRWHISLGAWFRDYLFYPISRSGWLGRLSGSVKKRWGKKAGKAVLAAVPAAVVWFCTGLWHGASWGYIIWGCYYGFLIILGIIVQPYTKKWRQSLHIAPNAKWFEGVQIARTMFLVLIAYVFFRGNGAWNALRYIGCMFGLMGNQGNDALSLFLLQDTCVLFLIAILGSTPLLKVIAEKLREKHPIAIVCIGNLCMIVLVLVCWAYVINGDYDPFIYFNF